MIILAVVGCHSIERDLSKQNLKHKGSDVIVLTEIDPCSLFKMPETLSVAMNAGFQKYEEVALKAYGGDEKSLKLYLQKTLAINWENSATEGYVADLNGMLERWGDIRISNIILNLDSRQKHTLRGYLSLGEHLGYVEKGGIDRKYPNIAKILIKSR